MAESSREVVEDMVPTGLCYGGLRQREEKAKGELPTVPFSGRRKENRKVLTRSGKMAQSGKSMHSLQACRAKSDPGAFWETLGKMACAC